MRTLLSGILLTLALQPAVALGAPAPRPTSPAASPAQAQAQAQEVPLPPPPTSMRPTPAASLAEPELRLVVGTALGHWSESGLDDSAPTTDFTAGLEWRLAPTSLLRLGLGGERYQRTHLPTSGGPVTSWENRWTVAAAYDLELLHWITPSRTTLELELAAGWQLFDDAIARTSAIPVGGGLRLAHPLAGAVEARIDAGVRLAAAATDPKAASVFGKLKTVSTFGLAAGWRLAGGHRVEVGYRAELLGYEHDYRILHLLGLQLGLGL
jgi:hypothetical protein